MPFEFHYDWHWSLPASPEALWPFVSNTNHFNRAAGVPHVERLSSAEGRQRLRLRHFGLPIEWDEYPFEWERPYRFSVRRVYHAGPVQEMRVQVELEAAAAGTELRYRIWALPRNPLGWAAIPWQLGMISRRRFRAVFEHYAREAVAQPTLRDDATVLEIALRSAPALLPAGAEQRLRSAEQRLADHGFDAALVRRLTDFIRRAEEPALVRLRPYLLADAWAAERRTVVELMLAATRAGLLDLQWELMCPLCRGAKESVGTLRSLPAQVHCDTCNIDITANFERAVELSFRPNPLIRPVKVLAYCVGGPQVTPHIAVQQFLAPGERRALKPRLDDGHYRIRSTALPGAQSLQVAEAASQHLELRLAAHGWSNDLLSAHPSAEVVIENTTDAAQLVVVERAAWSDYALTAAEATTLQKFRDLFSSEALRPGEAISVGSVAVLFTDLRDSTRLYQRIGDATAFGRVLDHFDHLKAAFAAEDGAVVKTIGDAVMAVFRRPVSAVRAVLRAQELLAHGPEGVSPQFLKAGSHFGPCIAVTLNDRLDYFGSTVNAAARIEGQSRGGELVVSDAMRFDPEVAALIASGVVCAQQFEVQLKGFEETPFSLWRITAATRTGQC